jgi:GNAT superfamily N-acetyltransferase
VTGRIRRARPDEAAILSDLALRSKGHWGYDAAFLEACRPHLTFTPDQVASEAFWVEDQDGRPVGFYRLTASPPLADLEDLWVDPDRIGSGVGGRLWADAVERARRLGCRTLRVEADPHAEAFYESRGAVRVDAIESPVQAGRVLPVLEKSLD